jgi:hypothetical protein
MTEKVRLARTWNGNESGTLWESFWYRQEGRYYKHLCAPGLFIPPDEFPDEDTFWAAFEKERTEFHGARIDGSPDAD